MSWRMWLILVIMPGFAILAAFLGGSAIWLIGGAHQLDVDGTPRLHGKAVNLPEPGWRYYGGDPGGHRFSRATQITPDNVSSLERAWTFSTGDLENRPRDALDRSAAETTPILAEDSLVFCSAFNEVIAIDPGTGKQKWRFDPEIDPGQQPANQFVCRGVAYWQSGDAKVTCASRILSATNDGRLLALDAKTGQPCDEFGDAGEVTIDPGMPLIWPGEFQITSPPVVIGDVVIIGSAISDNVRVEAPPGTVRAYDARTGDELWTFDPIPRSPDMVNAPDWQSDFPPVEGHANAWAPMSADLERGLLFVPTSSPSPDFYGGLRPGDNRYANSVVALDSKTGEVVWAFQTVHHDVWDYDLPAQPGLYTIYREGQSIDVVAQVAKTGMVFVLDRETGVPVIPVDERPVPQQGVEGEPLSRTQPFPVRPEPLVPTTTSADDAFGITWFDKKLCQNSIAALRSDGLYTPPTQQGTLFRPFTGGGANWGGSAYDPKRNLLVVNMSNLAHLIQLIPSENIKAAREVYHSSEIGPQTGAPYALRREMLLSPFDVPCTMPPWGMLMAVDIDKGELVWRRTLGTTEDLAGGLSLALGTPTLGGPIVTDSGIIFIGATMDYYLRAFDLESGNELWKGRLPTAGIATPMTYEWQGKQFVVIYAGGYPNADVPAHDTLVAFALPGSRN